MLPACYPTCGTFPCVSYVVLFFWILRSFFSYHHQNFGSVSFSKELLDQVVATQVAGLVVIVKVRSSILVGFSGTAFPSELERVVKVRFVVDADSKLRKVCMNHGQSIAGIHRFGI